MSDSALDLTDLALSELAGLDWDDEDASKKSARALCMLERLGPLASRAAPALIALANDDDIQQNAVACPAVANALVRVDPEKAVFLLQAWLTSDNDNLCFFAAQAVARGGPAAAGAADNLEKLLTHADWQVNGAAAVALVSIGRVESAMETIHQFLIKSDACRSCFVSKQLSFAGKFVAPVEPELVTALADSRENGLDDSVDASAAVALICMGADAGLVHVRRLLAHEDQTRRYKAVNQLGMSFCSSGAGGAVAAAADLLKALSDDGEAVSVYAAKALGRMGDAVGLDVVDSLKEVLKSDDVVDPALPCVIEEALQQISSGWIEKTM